MSPFGIFSIVLIALYIIYYTVLIARDLTPKRVRVPAVMMSTK